MDKQLTRQEVFTKAYIALIDGKIGSEEFFNLAWNAALKQAAKVADENTYGPCGEYDYSYDEKAAYADERAERIAKGIRALSSPAEAERTTDSSEGDQPCA